MVVILSNMNVGGKIKIILFYSILFYSILFYSILFYSILFYYIMFSSILKCRVCELSGSSSPTPWWPRQTWTRS